MKKFLFIVLCFCALLTATKETQAAVAGYEFLSKSVNALDIENIYIINKGEYVVAKNIDMFRVRPNQTYTFIFSDYSKVQYVSTKVIEYKNDRSKIKEYSPQTISFGNSPRFKTDANTHYMSFEIHITTQDSSVDLLRYYNYFLLEGDLTDTQITNYLSNQIPFMVDLEGMINVYDFMEIDSKLSNPVTVSQIQSSLRAFDSTDGEITSQIVIESDDFSNKVNKKGSFNVIFRVTNSNDISRRLTVKINSIDDVKPVITGTSEVTMYTTDLFTLEDIKEELSASDLVDGNIDNSQIYIKEQNFTNRQTQTGIFYVKYAVKDSSNNEAIHNVVINLLQGDTTAPVFSGPNYFESIVSDALYLPDILSHIQATDDYAGDVTSRIVVVYDEYSNNTERRGTYVIDLEVSDDAPNTSTFRITVLVIDNGAPHFFLVSTTYFIPLSANMQATADIIKNLAKTNNINSTEVTIKHNTYEENKYTPGSYLIVLESEEMEYNVCVSVVLESEYEIEIKTPKKSFFNKVSSFFNNIYRRIKGLFS